MRDLVEEHRRLGWGTFEVADLTAPGFRVDADVVVVEDVLFHLADAQVHAALENLRRSRWRLLVTTRRGVEETLRDYNCETHHELSGGVFHLRKAVGPCPAGGGGAHCYGGTRDRQLRWDGRKLVTVRTLVRCVLPRLDPKRDCRPRRD